MGFAASPLGRYQPGPSIRSKLDSEVQIGPRAKNSTKSRSLGQITEKLASPPGELHDHRTWFAIRPDDICTSKMEVVFYLTRRAAGFVGKQKSH